MAMDDLNLFANHDIPEDRKEGEHCRHSRLAIYDEERYMVNLETIGQVSNPGPPFICMCNDNDFMAAVYEFLELNEYCYQRIKDLLESVQLTIGRYGFQLHLPTISHH